MTTRLLLAKSAVCSFLITNMTIPSAVNLAYQKKLLSLLSAKRKVYTQFIPSLGKVDVLIGILLPFILFCSFEFLETYQSVFVSFIILCFIGIKGDLMLIDIDRKRHSKIFVAALLAFGDLRIISFPSL